MIEKIKKIPKLYIAVGLVLMLIIITAITVCSLNYFGNNASIINPNADNNNATDVTVAKPTVAATQIPTQKTVSSEKSTQATESSTEASTMRVNISSEIINNQIDNNQNVPQQSDPHQSVVQPTDTIVPTEAATESVEQQLNRLIANSGYTVDQINAQGISQLVVVDSFGTQADIYLYTNEGGEWVDNNLKCSGFVGKNGVAEKQGEGDNITPSGLYSIGDAFYINAQPSTWLNTFKITDNTYWVDDPNSVMYNKKVEGDQNKDWESAEHMIDYFNSYKFGFVINYNMNPIVPGKGSAIFMHCGTSETAGCIAVSETNMLYYLDKLNTAKNPYILIF